MNNLIEWHLVSAEKMYGYLIGHPETTLFILVAASEKEVLLTGAFIPDGEENTLRTLNDAKDSAERYLLAWLDLANSVVPKNAVNRGQDAQDKKP